MLGYHAPAADEPRGTQLASTWQSELEGKVMSVVLRIPGPLRALSGGRRQVIGAGSTLRQVLANVELECPGLSARILTAEGELAAHVNLFVAGDDVRNLGGLDAPIPADCVVDVVPAVSGGTGRSGPEG